MADVSSLTEREREVLRLVALGLQSGEIGLELNLSSGVVDNYVLAARRKLGGITRRQAARLLTESEMQSSQVQRSHLAEPDRLEATESSDQPAVSGQVSGVRETHAAFDHSPWTPTSRPERRDGYRSGTRTALTILALTVGTIFILAALPALIASFEAFTAWFLTFYKK